MNGPYVIDRPVRFAGTAEQRLANRNSHRWAQTDETQVCLDCDCSMFGEAANYPCGDEVPRERIEVRQ